MSYVSNRKLSIPNFATIAAPLVSLLKKGKQFCWGDKQQVAFTHLKVLLCTAPVLAYPRLDAPFKLQTDASDLGLGAVLTQSESADSGRVISGSVYTGPTEYLVGHIFGHLGVPFTRGRLTDLKLGHLGVQIFGRLGKRPSLELGWSSS